MSPREKLVIVAVKKRHKSSKVVTNQVFVAAKT